MINKQEFKYKTASGEEKVVSYIGEKEDGDLISPMYAFIDDLKNLMKLHNVKSIKVGTIGFNDNGEFEVMNCEFRNDGINARS